MEFYINKVSSSVGIVFFTELRYAIHSGEAYLRHKDTTCLVMGTYAKDSLTSFKESYGVYLCLKECIIIDTCEPELLAIINKVESLYKEIKDV